MAKPFDAATKWLLEIDPPAWLACAGLTPTGPVRVIDSDVSTVTAEADTIFAVGEPIVYLAHIELQASRDRTLPHRLLRYNVLLNYRHEVPVHSVAILLRPEADGPEMSGLHQVRHHEGDAYLDFHYAIVRVWDLDLETVLTGGLGTLPLAPLTRAARADPEPVIRRISERLDREVPTAEAGDLWSATGILMGLQYAREVTSQLLRGVRAMKESTFYQAILEEGEAKGEARGLAKGEARGREEASRHATATLRETILRYGEPRFGVAPRKTLLRLDAIQDDARLTRLVMQILVAANWDDLLTTP